MNIDDQNKEKPVIAEDKERGFDPENDSYSTELKCHSDSEAQLPTLRSFIQKVTKKTTSKLTKDDKQTWTTSLVQKDYKQKGIENFHDNS